MGTWEGHISPGFAFYSFGIVYCFQFARDYLLQGRKEGYDGSQWKHNSALKTIYVKIKQFPVDAFLKLLYGFGAAMAEFFYPPGTNKLYLQYPNGDWAHLNEWQHFTMYISFAVSGVVDIISQKVLKERVVAAEKAAVAGAFYITSILLFYHKHGKHELEMEAHELLFYASLMMCAVLTLEIWRPYDRRLMLSHTLLVMQLGSWLFHLAFILFPSKGHEWNPEDKMNQMVLPIFFCWHIFLNASVFAAIFLTQFLYLKFSKSKVYRSMQSCEMEPCPFDSPNRENDLEGHFEGTTSKGREANRGADDESTPLFSDTETTYA